MTQEQVVTLAQIYNSLMQVETKGQSTRILGQCLDALEELILNLQNEIKQKGENKNGN